MNKLILTTLSFLMLASCSAKVDAGGDLPMINIPAGDSTPAPGETKPTVNCELNQAVNGVIDGKTWKFKSGVAYASMFGDGWDVTLSETVDYDPCYQMASSRGISFHIPKNATKFDLTGANVVNFYDMGVSPSLNINTNNGEGIVSNLMDSEISGTLQAYRDEKTGACGTFRVVRCDGRQ